jgi:exopolyphosphatase/guanosine-5'-triphosphate,3'-diphosphate pyrophosphatase
MNPPVECTIPEDFLMDTAAVAVIALMKRFDPDNSHAITTMRLSIRLFDELKTLHGLDFSERRLLMFGALLHDIGWSCPQVPHHKGSLNLILADTTIPIRDEERVILALITRYHRKAHPSSEHPLFSSLLQTMQQQVRWSAAILRVADALDRPHCSNIRDISVQISQKTLIITCSVSHQGYPLHRTDWMKKATLLAELSERTVEII